MITVGQSDSPTVDRAPLRGGSRTKDRLALEKSRHVAAQDLRVAAVAADGRLVGLFAQEAAARMASVCAAVLARDDTPPSASATNGAELRPPHSGYMVVRGRDRDAAARLVVGWYHFFATAERHVQDGHTITPAWLAVKQGMRVAAALLLAAPRAKGEEGRGKEGMVKGWRREH